MTIQINKISYHENMVEIYLDKPPEVDCFEIKVIEPSSTAQVSEKILNQGDSNQFTINLKEFHNQPIHLNIKALKDSQKVSSKEIELSSDVFDECNKESFHYLVENLKQYFAFSALVIAGVLALLPLLYSSPMQPNFAWLIYVIIGFFLLTALLSIACQGIVVNESSIRRFDIHDTTLKRIASVAVYSLLLGLFFLFVFLFINKDLLTKKSLSIKKTTNLMRQSISIDQSDFKFDWEGTNATIKIDQKTGKISEILIKD